MRPLMLVTCPPLEIATVPTPPKAPPTERSPLIVQVEPVPSTVTLPLPFNVPRKALPLETVPPLVMLRVPSPPSLLSSRRPVFVQLDPGPLTLTSPLLAGFIPIVLLKLETTWPPLEIVSVPAPDAPIPNKQHGVIVQEPVADTVAVPLDARFSPIMERALETTPPFVMLRLPVPLL